MTTISDNLRTKKVKRNKIIAIIIAILIFISCVTTVAIYWLMPAKHLRIDKNDVGVITLYNKELDEKILLSDKVDYEVVVNLFNNLIVKRTGFTKKNNNYLISISFGGDSGKTLKEVKIADSNHLVTTTLNYLLLNQDIDLVEYFNAYFI